MGSVADVLGEVGLPMSISELSSATWDAVVVGGGHNGLTSAAYLARAGKKVLVLEKSERVGGACTLERPFPDQRYIVSPCAYVVGLLDQTVIDELELGRRGLKVFVADPNLWAPFPDGTSFTQWSDDAKTQASLDALGISKADSVGYWQYEHVFDEMRRRLRCGTRDTWVGESPDRAELESMLNDSWMSHILFDASIAEVMSHYFRDTRLHDALFGQAVIGAYAGPHDHGTASVKLMHYQGNLEGQGPVWGYVQGGMGMVSFTIADAAIEAGAIVASGVEVGEIIPGEGVRLVGGEMIHAPIVLCNADPRRLLNLVDQSSGDAVPSEYRAKLTSWKMRSPVVKFNAALHRLPTFTAANGGQWPFKSMITVTHGMQAAQRAFAECERGIPSVGFGEVYFQTGFDATPAPDGSTS
jgi:phytoene dehydrogenase-like protein